MKYAYLLPLLLAACTSEETDSAVVEEETVDCTENTVTTETTLTEVTTTTETTPDPTETTDTGDTGVLE